MSVLSLYDSFRINRSLKGVDHSRLGTPDRKCVEIAGCSSKKITPFLPVHATVRKRHDGCVRSGAWQVKEGRKDAV
jgi:hypothetical protein